MLKIALFLLVIGSAVQALAGFDKGNGGHGLYCHIDSPQAKTVELFDFYEARTIHNLKLEAKVGTSFADSYEQIVRRLKLKDASLAEVLGQGFEYFLNNSVYTNFELGASEDSRHVLIPENCELIQAVLQRDNLITGKRQFIVSQKVWTAMSDFQKAGLILHEIIYWHSIHTDSRRVRYLVGWLFAHAEDLEQFSDLQIREEFDKAGWKL